MPRPLSGGVMGTILVFVALVGGGVWMTMDILHFLDHSILVQGTVVKNVVYTEKESTTYAPEIEFEAFGKPRTFIDSFQSRPALYQPGDKVMMRFESENPADVRIDSFWNLWLGPLVLFGLSGFLGAWLIYLFV